MSIHSTESLGTKIRRMRTEKGWSQEHLASVSDVSERTIRRLEGGQRIASLATLQALASAFDIDVATLTVLLDSPAKPPGNPLVHHISTGCEFFAALAGAHFLERHIGEPINVEDHQLLRQLLEQTEAAEIWSDITPASQFDEECAVTTVVRELQDRGWLVGVGRVRRSIKLDNAELPDAVVATLVVEHVSRLQGAR